MPNLQENQKCRPIWIFFASSLMRSVSMLNSIIKKIKNVKNNADLKTTDLILLCMKMKFMVIAVINIIK